MARPSLPGRIGGPMLLGGLLLASTAGAAPGALGCDRAVHPAFAEALYRELAALPRTPGCEFVSLTTAADVCEVRLAQAGQPEASVVIGPRGCLPGPTHRGPTVDARIPTTLSPPCAAFAREVGAAVERFDPGITLPTAPSRSPLSRFPLPAAAAACLLVALGALRRLGLRAALGTLAALLAGWGVALGLRLAVEPALANWYLEVIPHGEGRFGAAALQLQRLAAWLGPFDDRALFALTSALGAAAVVVVGLLGRQLTGSAWVGAAAAAFLAVTPLHVRVSASGAEHVLASLASLATVLLWTHAVVARRWLAALAAVLTAVVAVTSRVDAVAFLALTPLWPLAARLVPWDRRALLGAALGGGAWVGLAALAVVAIAIPARHPLPSPEAVVHHLANLPASSLAAALDPGWLPVSLLLFALVGAVALGRRRPALLALCLVALAVVHGAVARDWEEGMLVGRYLLTALMPTCLLAGVGVEVAFRAALGLLRRRRAREDPATPRVAPVAERRLAVALGVALALVLGVESQRGRQVRYAFQDEYAFLRRALAAAPAGCAVAQLGPRQPAFPRDLDCCLDLPQSPLTLAFPALPFVSLASADELGRLAAGRPCTLYYEGALCEVGRHGVVEPMDRPTVAWLGEHCDRALHGMAVTPLAEAHVSRLTTARFFPRHEPRVTLYRVQPR